MQVGRLPRVDLAAEVEQDAGVRRGVVARGHPGVADVLGVWRALGDVDHYLADADERGRPFVDLLTRVPAERPRVVVDLGCGPHLDLLSGLLDRVAPGGWLAFQVPGNFDEPSHTIRAATACIRVLPPEVVGTLR